MPAPVTEHHRQLARFVDERRVLDDLGSLERDPEKESQRRSVLTLRQLGALGSQGLVMNRARLQGLAGALFGRTVTCLRYFRSSSLPCSWCMQLMPPARCRQLGLGCSSSPGSFMFPRTPSGLRVYGQSVGSPHRLGFSRSWPTCLFEYGKCLMNRLLRRVVAGDVVGRPVWHHENRDHAAVSKILSTTRLFYLSHRACATDTTVFRRQGVLHGRSVPTALEGPHAGLPSPGCR